MLRIQCSIQSLCWLQLFHVVTDNNGLKQKISLESNLILLLGVSGANVCTVFICSENKRHLRSFGQTAWVYGGVSSFNEQMIFDLQKLKKIIINKVEINKLSMFSISEICEIQMTSPGNQTWQEEDKRNNAVST